MHLLIGLSRKDNRQRMETPRTHGMSRRWCSMYAAHERERTRLPAQHQRTERLPGERTDALLRRARKCYIILYYNRYVQIHAVALKRLGRVEMHLLIGLSRKDNRQRMETPRTHGMSRRWCSMYAAHERERTRLPAQHQRTERLPGERTDALLRRARKCYIILYYIMIYHIILYHNILYYIIL